MRSNYSFEKQQYKFHTLPNISNFNNKIHTQEYQYDNRFNSQQQSSMYRGSQNRYLRSPTISSRDNPRRSTAPQTQYQAYLCDTKNVFYQDRQQAKYLKIFQKLRPILNITLTILFFSWLGLSYIKPIPQQLCPMNANCAVFIHCHNGYSLKNGQCLISQKVKQQASQISMAVLKNLRQRIGMIQCGSLQNISKIKDNIDKVFIDYDVQKYPVQSSITNWLISQENQKKYKYKYQNGIITTKQKEYTLICQAKILLKSDLFGIFIVLAFVFVIFVIVFIRILQQQRKIKNIYQFLKQEVQKEKDVVIKKRELESKFGKINKELWKAIDEKRVQNEEIAYYEDQHLHWVLIEN